MDFTDRYMKKKKKKKKKKEKEEKEEEERRLRFNCFLIYSYRNRTHSRRCNHLSAFYITRCLCFWFCSYYEVISISSYSSSLSTSINWIIVHQNKNLINYLLSWTVFIYSLFCMIIVLIILKYGIINNLITNFGLLWVFHMKDDRCP